MAEVWAVARCLLMLSLVTSVCLQNPKLKLVHVIYRHGDRSPTKTFPSDGHQEDAWPQGFGQLSTMGMRQEYQLGQFLRKRYIDDTGFLESAYNRHEITVRSTDKDRTLMSAESVLAGLYPPSGDQVWNTKINWQPIPVHTVRLENDPLLWGKDAPCPARDVIVQWSFNSPELKFIEENNKMLHLGSPCHEYHQLYYKVYESQEALRYKKENKEFLDSLRENSGLKNATLYDLMEAIPDALYCEKAHNKTLDPWVTEDIFNKTRDLKALEFKFYFYTPEMTRFQSGIFLYTLVNHTQEYFVGSYKDGRKMFMYSAHDSTLAAILAGLGVWSGEIPPYSSSIMFELYENKPHQYSMQIWYRNSSTQDPDAKPILLQLDDCDADCEISQFYHLLDHLTIPGVDAWHKECGNNKNPASHFNGNTVAIVLSVIAVIVVFGIIFLMCYRRKKDYPYHSANFSDPPDA